MLKAVSRYIADRQGTEISKVDGDALLRGYQIHAMNRTSPGSRSARPQDNGRHHQ